MIVDDALRAMTLPPGFIARRFEERDREPLVAIRNEDQHPLQHWYADEWREWERVVGDPEELRVVVADARGVVALGSVSKAGAYRFADGAAGGGVVVARRARARGIGSALLALVEAEARRRGAPRFVVWPGLTDDESVAWATQRGYVEIDRRVPAALELSRFEPGAFAGALERARASGAQFATLAELLASRDEAGREALRRERYGAEGRCYRDVPAAGMAAFPSYEDWRRQETHSSAAPDLSVLAIVDGRIAAFTITGRRGPRDGGTWFTGTLPEFRGRGLALAAKAEAFARAKAAGLRAMLTTNDQANAAMRGINARLGYEPLPTVVRMEKPLR